MGFFFFSPVKVGQSVGIFFFTIFFLIAEKDYQGKVYDLHDSCVSFCPWYFKTL